MVRPQLGSIYEHDEGKVNRLTLPQARMNKGIINLAILYIERHYVTEAIILPCLTRRSLAVLTPAPYSNYVRNEWLHELRPFSASGS
jgi:hypothetical protein